MEPEVTQAVCLSHYQTHEPSLLTGLPLQLRLQLQLQPARAVVAHDQTRVRDVIRPGAHGTRSVRPCPLYLPNAVCVHWLARATARRHRRPRRRLGAEDHAGRKRRRTSSSALAHRPAAVGVGSGRHAAGVVEPCARDAIADPGRPPMWGAPGRAGKRTSRSY